MAPLMNQGLNAGFHLTQKPIDWTEDFETINCARERCPVKLSLKKARYFWRKEWYLKTLKREGTTQPAAWDSDFFHWFTSELQLPAVAAMRIALCWKAWGTIAGVTSFSPLSETLWLHHLFQGQRSHLPLPAPAARNLVLVCYSPKELKIDWLLNWDTQNFPLMSVTKKPQIIDCCSSLSTWKTVT